ncbi:hypothetical protein COMA2_140121 [Candidatus Nitrospira nitrificans]|uniref:Uncharacterized protein n=2 Tax=Candidatus Nitrospira nitrificans TaxID=1742973 RepID=A0A0S4LDA3_9BACT|nr:hypothetical protein COMA2_140121 [Candidatus Nitrospira nitrificans]
MGDVPQMTKADLLETYTRRLTERTGEPLKVRELFLRMAEAMADQLTYSLPLREIEQIASSISDHPSSAIDLLTSASRSNLVEVRYNRSSFRHEQFQLYFEAEALLRQNSERQVLASTLARPRNRHLSEMVIPMITDEAVLRDALIGLEDGKIIAACLQSSLGPLAKNVSRSDAEQVLHACYVNAGEFALRIGDQADVHPLVDSLVIGEGVLSLTSYEKALLRAAGSFLYEDVFLDEVLSLIRRTDNRIDKILKEWPPEHRKLVRGGLFADLYIFEKPGEGLWPTSFITTACHNAFRSQAKPPVLSKIARLLDGSKSPTAGELYVCALLLAI